MTTAKVRGPKLAPKRPIPGTAGWYHTLTGAQQDRLTEAWKTLLRRDQSTAKIAENTCLSIDTVRGTRSGEKNFTRLTAIGIALALRTTVDALLNHPGLP